MKRIFLTMAAASAFAAAAPAAAQYARHDPYSQDGLFQSRAGQIEVRIDEAGRSGALTAYQTTYLRNQLWQLQRLERSYSRNGLSEWERSDLRTRLAAIDRQVGGTYGRDWDDRYDLDNNGYDDRTDRDGNGYDDLLDSDGNGHDDRYDRDGDGRADSPADWRGGISPSYNSYGYDPYDYGNRSSDGQYGSGLSGDRGYDRGQDTPDGQGDDSDMLGDDRASSDWTGDDQITSGPDIGRSSHSYAGDRSDALRVGDVAPADLDPVPSQLRGLYPDGSGVYYRFDDGRILQIERSTGVIRWIGNLNP